MRLPSMVLAATCWLSVVARGVSCPMACGILVPRPGIELTSPYCKADSQPLDHQGSPKVHI